MWVAFIACEPAVAAGGLGLPAYLGLQAIRQGGLVSAGGLGTHGSRAEPTAPLPHVGEGAG